MSSIKRMVVLCGLAIVAAMAMAVPAQASAVKADCVIDGEAKVTDKADPAYGVRIQGGKGSYTFTDVAIVCVGTAKGAPLAVTLSVTSSGTYENVICGTGKAQSDPGTAADPAIVVNSASDGNADKYNALLFDEKYSVEFNGTNGTFWWHDSDKDTPDLKTSTLDPDKDGNTDEKDYDLGGDVQLGESLAKPSTFNVPPGNCVKAFHINADITIDES